MRLQHLYRATFTPTEHWSVEIKAQDGVEGQGFLLVEGRTEGRLTARLRAANWPRQRADRTLTPDFRGALETDDGATVLFAWHGFGRTAEDGSRQLLGSMTHLSNADRYRWLNTAVCAVAGEIYPREGGGFDVVLDVAEIIWEPLEPGDAG